VSESAGSRVLLMHPVLDPAPALLEESAVDVVPYPSGGPLTEEAIREAVETGGCQGILSQVMDPIGETVLSTPGLEIVSNVAVGYDNIDLPAATRCRVMATNTPGVLTDTTADFAFALVMAAARRVAEGDRFVREGRFGGWAMGRRSAWSAWAGSAGRWPGGRARSTCASSTPTRWRCRPRWSASWAPPASSWTSFCARRTSSASTSRSPRTRTT
jgi:glyoxylate reductase